MPRIVSIATALAWLFLWLFTLAVSTADGGVLFRDPVEMICVLIVVSITIAAVSFALRPRRWLALLLLCISAAPALPLSWGAWKQLSLFFHDKSGFMSFTRTYQFSLGITITFVALAFLWGVICLRWRDVTKT